MSRFDLFAKFANFMKDHGPNSLTGGLVQPPTRKELRALRPPRFKPAFSMGFRGAPKTETRPGSIPAPTIDQVRNRERKYGQRIHVKNGLMFFAADGMMWTKEEAATRLEKSLRSVC